MGILNVTPDSFSDGGEHASVDAAVAHGLRLVEDGADILDIGGESTRPNSEPVSEAEELRRVVPVIRELARHTSAPISIDTTKAAVAQAALEAGAAIVNDISGLTFEPAIIDVCRTMEAGVVCMHIQGTPQTMQINPQYDDVVRDIRGWLSDRIAALKAAGIASERIVLDPGIGFGKTPEHNISLLSNVAALQSLGSPILIGHSRKRFIGKLLGRKVDERNFGTVGISIALAQQHVEILRIHDVRAVRDSLLAWDAVASRIQFRR
ncbi:MAG: dihydropteroate synthase [Planctomycetaceae bacterium]|nr:dihydropteroate synthase [Planctomycetaceae bacterium]